MPDPPADVQQLKPIADSLARIESSLAQQRRQETAIKWLTLTATVVSTVVIAGLTAYMTYKLGEQGQTLQQAMAAQGQIHDLSSEDSNVRYGAQHFLAGTRYSELVLRQAAEFGDIASIKALALDATSDEARRRYKEAETLLLKEMDEDERCFAGSWQQDDASTGITREFSVRVVAPRRLAPVAYTEEKPPIARSSDELRSTIAGWGVDKDPADRPSFPKEVLQDTGAHWDFPERQQPRGEREKSTEHKFLTPVFGTAQPLHGLSGAIRRYAYTFSEGQTAHWLLLMAGDRVDVLESRFTALLQGRPDNPITETGVLREFRGGAYRTRFGQHRTDLKHLPLDWLLWAAPYAAIGCGVYMAARQLSSRRY